MELRKLQSGEDDKEYEVRTCPRRFNYIDRSKGGLAVRYGNELKTEGGGYAAGQGCHRPKQGGEEPAPGAGGEESGWIALCW